MRPTHPFLDHPGPIAFAHRGGAGDEPENTLPAFEAAVRLGYRYLETDVHATADGVVVAFHDDTLDRVTDGSGVIGELPWSEVRSALVDGRAPVPRLDELLAAFPRQRFNLDPKHDAVVGPLLGVLARYDALDRVCVGSFSDRRLAEIRRRAGPGLCTSLGPRGIAVLRGRLRALRLDGQCAQVPVAVGGRVLVDDGFVATAHRRGLAVHVWTVDEPDEMHRLLDLGVDGIMTDRPAVLRAVLESRGQWVDARG